MILDLIANLTEHTCQRNVTLTNVIQVIPIERSHATKKTHCTLLKTLLILIDFNIQVVN